MWSAAFVLIRKLVVALGLGLGASVLVWFSPLPAIPLRSPDLASAPGPTAPPAATPVARPAVMPAPSPLPTRPAPVTVPLSASTTVLAYPAPPIQARAAYLMDMRTGRVLYQKNADTRLPMASTTKITTALVTLQHARLDELATTSQRAATIGESTMVLRRGERLTVRQLLYGLLLNSANDAAITLAEHVGGTESRFVGMMNALAWRLHMWHTHYVTSHGLDAPGHYTSAHDLAIVARYAMRNPEFRAIVATTSYHIPRTKHNQEHWLASVNRVIYWYPGVDGVKPGDTDLAGLCQVVSVRRDGRRLLAVLLNTPTLVFDIRNLLDFGLRDFRWVQAPAYWDGPSDSLSGGRGSSAWVYYFGAGHYIRGLFLAYFRTHGGLQTLGYPRTEAFHDGDQLVQYFQGGELVYDPAHRSVYPADLGLTLAHAFAARSPARPGRQVVAAGLHRLYGRLGGRGVFGEPVSLEAGAFGQSVQFYQYGALMGGGWVAPLGDVALRLRGWLPATGAADSYPASMLPLGALRFPASRESVPVPRKHASRPAPHRSAVAVRAVALRYARLEALFPQPASARAVVRGAEQLQKR